MSKLIDRTGQRYGRLVVIERAPDQVFSSGRKVVRWKCKCDCGNIVEVATTSLGSGLTQSCGCWNNEQRKKSETKKIIHGDCNKDKEYHNLYERWITIKKRCYQKSKDNYKNYGGRGITVCDKWLHNYTAFKEWALANNYSPELTIDRIDNNKNYSPDNCRWVDNKTQQNNKRSNTFITYNGKTKTLQQWADETGINNSTISSRLKNGWSVESALTTPPLR